MKLNKSEEFHFSFPQNPVQKPRQTPFFLAKGLVGFLDFVRKEV
jgi:hypothetical protein